MSKFKIFLIITNMSEAEYNKIKEYFESSDKCFERKNGKTWEYLGKYKSSQQDSMFSSYRCLFIFNPYNFNSQDGSKYKYVYITQDMLNSIEGIELSKLSKLSKGGRKYRSKRHSKRHSKRQSKRRQRKPKHILR